MQIQLRSAPRFFALGKDDQRRQQEHDAEQKQQDPDARQESELRHSAEISRQKREERSGRGDRGHEHARHGRAHDRADRLLHRRSAVPLVDVAAVQDGDEVDAQARQQCRESGTGLGQLAIGDAGHPEREQQSQRERRSGVDDRSGSAEGVEKQRQHAEDRAEDVVDDVFANEVGVTDRNLVAAGVRDFRQRRSRRRALLKIAQRFRLEQRALVQQRFSERHVLRRPLRLGQDQQHAVIGRHVVAARCVDAEAAAGGLELAKKNRREVERIVLNERLHGHGLRRLEHGRIARHGPADALVGKFRANFVELRRRQEQQRFRQDDLDEIEWIGNLVRDIRDPRIFPISLRHRIDEGVVVMDVASFGHVHEHDVVVDRAEVFEDFAELIDLLVLLRDEVEQIGIKGDARGAEHGQHRQHERRDQDFFVAPQAEARQRVEDSVGQFNSRGIVRVARKAGG